LFSRLRLCGEREAASGSKKVIMRFCCLFFALLAQPEPAPRCVSKIGGDFLQHLQWAPDGKRFLFTRIQGKSMALWTMNVDGSDVKRLLPNEKEPHFDGHWSPDSQRIVFVHDRLKGTDGELQIDIVSAEGIDRKTLVPKVAFEESPRWAPDGKTIAWVSTRAKNPDIWTIGADGKNAKQLTNDPAFDINPSWSPDGKQIAFCSTRHGNYEIYVMNSDGSDVRRLTDHPKMDYWPAWSPDGKRIAFTSNRDGNYEIYVMQSDGSRPRNVSKHPASDNYAAWSPDGAQLAFISNRGGAYEIYITDVK
jgi:TolB protein